MTGVRAFAHNIEVQNSDGVTIYYNYNDGSNGSSVSVTFRGSYSGQYSNEYSGNVVIPETVTYNDMTYSVTSIGKSAFSDCSGLTSVTIPRSITTIGDYAFSGCSGLSSVIIIPEEMTYISVSAFNGTKWLNDQPDGVIYINNILYKYKGEMPANTSITIRDGVTRILSYAFQNCSGLTSVNIPNSVTHIGGYVFKGCSGISVTIPNSVSDIHVVFSGCGIINQVVIPNSVTEIKKTAFNDCIVKKLIVGNSLASIGDRAFNHPIDTLICYSETPPEILYEKDYNNHIKTQSIQEVGLLCVPLGSIEKYQSVYNWKIKSGTIRAIPGISINQRNVYIDPKKTTKLETTLLTDDDIGKPVIWTSSDKNILTVDDRGIVTAVNPGNAYVVSTLKSIIDVYDTCYITVKQPVTGIAMEKTSLTLTQLGEMKQLVANVMPENAYDKSVTWTSTNPSVCSVTSNGTVIATGYGTSIIIAVTVDGGFPAVCTVTVSDKPTYKAGDVNHDGSITMADANMVVNYFLAAEKPEDFDIETADVNNDGSITMADANMIVNMFLGGEK